MSVLFTPQANGFLSAANVAQLQPIRAVKPSDVAQALTTTLINDAALLVPVAASAEYEITVHIIYTQGTTGQLTVGFSGPSGATFDWVPMGLATSVTASDSGSMQAVGRSIVDTRAVGGTSTPCVLRIEGRLVVSSTPGNLNLQWAQSVSNATGVTVKAKSYMVARQIA